MEQHHKIILFKDKSIRSYWDADAEEWFFSVVDVVAYLTDSANPTDYLKKLRKRDTLLGEYLGTHCPQVAMQTASGKTRNTLAASTRQLLRIVQSIPSKKAEPFKLCLAELSTKEISEVSNPQSMPEHEEMASRCDVTLLVNGLPLVQVELKKRGVPIREAFNQLHRHLDRLLSSPKPHMDNQGDRA